MLVRDEIIKVARNSGCVTCDPLVLIIFGGGGSLQEGLPKLVGPLTFQL